MSTGGIFCVVLFDNIMFCVIFCVPQGLFMPKQKTVYDIIKGQNGEHFARAVRDNGLLDIPNLPEVVKYAGRDAEPILNYLESLKNIQIKDQPVHGDPIELLARAGYDAYVADTLEKQNAIEKYFASGEALCTFTDSTRYKNYYIINAVRRDLDKIVRPAHPSRQDEYGTSVISIQILKSGGRISIKNRYNHTVENPDNTFGSNPDNIISGLSDALRTYFNVDFSANCKELPDDYTIVNKSIVKYNYESLDIYYGKDFYVEHGKIKNWSRSPVERGMVKSRLLCACISPSPKVSSKKLYWM